MIDLDELAPDERGLRYLMTAAADAAPLGAGGTAAHAMHPPAPNAVLALGRRARTRRRIARGSAAVLSLALVTGGGLAVGTGAVPLPGLQHRADGVAPADLIASRGTKVGDLVNDLDEGFGWVAGDDASGVGFRYRAKAGESTPTLRSMDGDGTGPDALRQLREAQIDRAVRTRSVDGPYSGRMAITLVRTSPGTTDEVESRALPTLSLGDGPGRWLRVRPSSADGWLVFAVLPPGSELPQVRVAGTEVTVPIDWAAGDLGSCAGSSGDCDPGRIPISIVLRIASTSEDPPVDAITYVDPEGRSAVIDETSAQTIVD